jgi:lipopolysaccharide export LptBFGC system permease protein LptF
LKIIDRYVLSMFIKNYLISFMVLIGMYIALDMVFNFANLTQAHGTATPNLSFARELYDISDFYFYQSFVFFVQLSGVIAVVAAAFTMMRLSRFNEVTALLAAGMPLLRVAVSVILAGVVLNLVLLPIDQELLIPRMIPKLMREHSDVHETNIHTYPVHMMQDNNSNGLFNAALYYPPVEGSPAHLLYLDVIKRDANLHPVKHLSADSADWNSDLQRWDLTNGVEVPIASPDVQAVPPPPVSVAFYQSDITPEEITLNNLGSDYIQLLPTARLNELLDPSRAKSYGTMDLLRTKHMRFTQPIANVIILLLAISAVLTREPNTLKLAAMKCMALTGLCMGCVFLSYQLAAASPSPQLAMVWPALMAWMPIFIFGPLSTFLLDHIKS